MRAVGYGPGRSGSGPDCLRDLTLPEPELRPDDLLVQVEAVAINPVDTKVRRRETPAAGSWRVLGWDAAGTVARCGTAVTSFQPGDRVWYAGALDRPGCQSELHAVDHRLVAHRPTNLGADAAAALPLTAITAWELLFDRLRLSSGLDAHREETLLVVGGAGGVGSMLVQLALRLTGLTVVATASRPASVDWLHSLGVTHVIDHHRPLADQLQRLALPPVRQAISLTHSGDHFAALVDLLEPQGALALIDDPPAQAIDVLAMKRKSLSLHWELMFTRSLYQTADMAEQGRLLARLRDLVQAGQIRSTLQRHLGPIHAEGIQEAHRLIEQGSSIGKIVLAGW